MNGLKATEKLMRKSCNSPDKRLADAYSKLSNMFKFVDYADNTNHISIINRLYERPDANYTMESIAMQENVSSRTLTRYRHLYANCFCYYLFVANGIECDEEAIANYIKKR